MSTQLIKCVKSAFLPSEMVRLFVKNVGKLSAQAKKQQRKIVHLALKARKIGVFAAWKGAENCPEGAEICPRTYNQNA